MAFITPQQASELTGFHVKTLAKWADEGKIPCIKSDGGHRRYDSSSLKKMIGEDDRDIILYARVSTHSQKDDLETQTSFLLSRRSDGKLISEIGSGLNFKRKKLISVLEQVVNHKVKEIVVAYPDRLARFGFDLIVWLCGQFDCKITVLNEEKLSPHQELVQDILTILHHFSAKLYFLRKYEKSIKRNAAKESQDEDSMKLEPIS